jgi:hypothetical protein
MMLILVSIGFAQTNRFEDLKQNIETKIKSNLWDDVLLTASDLIIEDFTKGDGYYYSALAFYKIGDVDNTNKYITKAKNIADASLLVKIKVLEQTISSAAEAQLMVKSAIDFELSTKKNASANAWYRAWQYDKYRIEYALNAVSHYLDLKEYKYALEVLNQPEVYQDKMAKELISKINNTPEMISLNGYNNSIASGDNNLRAKKFAQAKSSYEDALKFKPNDQYAISKITEVIEEIEWEEAINSKFVVDTEKYADNYPGGKYIDKANDIIKISYFSIAEKAFKEKNESKMVEFHNKYLQRFPNESGLYKIRDLLLEYYYTEGLNRYTNKEWSYAKSNFQSYLRIKNTGEQAEKCKQLIKRCEWKLKQQSTGFIAYSYDSISPIGISFGRLNKNGIGLYSTLKLNNHFFTSLNGTIDDAGNTELESYNEAKTHTRLNEIQNANASISLGLTIKVVYPLYMYIGAGGVYTSVYDRWEATDPDYVLQNVDRTYWLKNTDKTEFNYFPESGLILKVSNSLILKYGIIFSKNTIHQFGIGFQL